MDARTELDKITQVLIKALKVIGRGRNFRKLKESSKETLHLTSHLMAVSLGEKYRSPLPTFLFSFLLGVPVMIIGK